MADKGQGIRLFQSRAQLEAIFDEFEAAEDSNDADNESEDTVVQLSRMRWWVIQVSSRPSS